MKLKKFEILWEKGRQICSSLLLIIIIFFPVPVYALYKIAAVQSIRVAPYEEAIKGFKKVCNVKIERVVLSELGDSDVVDVLQKLKPDLALAIGMSALSKLKNIRSFPVVYLMVLNPHSLLSEGVDFTGVSMNVPQEIQIRKLLEFLPDIRTIGIIYNIDKSEILVKGARNAAKKTGIRLISKNVSSSREVPLIIDGFKDKIDVFWMLPDITVLTPETIEALLLFSLENKVPIITFSKKYLALGALLAIGIDPFDIGTQAGEMANQILAGKDAKNIPRVDVRKIVVSINETIAKKLGINMIKN